MTEIRYAATPRVVAAFLAAGLLALAAAANLDRPGRLLAGVAAAVLLAEGVRLAAFRPTLAAGPEGLTLRRSRRADHLPWRDVERVAPLSPAGAGRAAGALRRRARALEIDLGHTVVIVPGHRLGRPLEQVVSELEALRRAHN